MKILTIVPAYNEAANIEQVVRDLRKYCPETDILVVNDCSTDQTQEILEQNGIPYLNLPVNLGIGGGVQNGYQYAQEHEYDVAIQFDGDGQHEAQYMHTLIAAIEDGTADFVIGSRFLGNEGFQSSPMRRLGIRFLSRLIRMLCGIQIHDVTSGMRAVNRKMMAWFARDYAQDYPEPEAILSAGLLGARIKEVPVQMRERVSGRSSINAIRAVYYMIKVTLALVLVAWTTPKNRKETI